MQEQSKATLDYELPDYGDLLFEYDARQKVDPLYVSSERRKANFKSPFFYFILAIPFVMVCWFVASLIYAIGLEGNDKVLRIGLTLGSLIPMAFCCFFAIMIAFGFWGHLYAWKFGGKYNKKEKFIRIYKDYVVAKKHGTTVTLEMSQIKSVILRWYDSVTFITNDYKIEGFFLEIPKSITTATRLERIFGDKLSIDYSVRHAEPCDSISWGEFVIGLIFSLAAMGLGVGLICMHIYLHVNVPIFLGAMFIGGGVLILCGILSFVPFIKDIVTPIMAAAFFIAIPWAMVSALHGVWGLGEGFKSLTIFSPLSCVALLLSATGALLFAGGILAIIDYVRYGHKLGKN